jgi:predicted nucleic acid-binding protein
MKLLFDTSAIVKRYKVEQGHDAVARLFGDASAIVLAAHCKVEIASGFSREVHDGAIDAAQYGSAMAEVAEDFDDFEVLPITPEIEALAIAAMTSHRLRAMDALHIGTAQMAQVDLFVTADRQQAKAAQASGLKTELIRG